MSTRVRLVVGSEANDADLREHWQRLAAVHPDGGFPNSPWFADFVDRLIGPPEIPAMAVLESAGRVAALWPLAHTGRRALLGKIRLLTHRNRGQAYHGEPLVDPDFSPSALIPLMDHLRRWRGWDQIDIHRIRDRVMGAIGPTSPGGAPVVCHTKPAPVISPSEQRNFARRRRRISEQGAEFHWHTEPGAVGRAATRFIELHTALKVHQGQYPIFRARPDAAIALPSALAELAALGHASALTLIISGEVAGTQLLLHEPGHTYAWRLGWNPQLAHLGLGLAIVDHAIALGRSRGDRAFHLGPGSEPYKRRWANDEIGVLHWRARRRNLATTIESVRQWWRQGQR